MGEYTVTIQGAPDFTFSFAAAVTWEDPERTFDRSKLPNLLVSIRRRILVVGELPDDTPAAVRATFATLMASHLNSRTIPTFIRILDPTSTPIPDIGEITSVGNAWEDVGITEFSMDSAEPGQLRARAVITFVVEGTRLFFNGGTFADFDQELSVEAGDDFREVSTLRSIVKVAAGADVQDQAAALRLAAPPGFVRLAPSNRVSGISIRYPNEPRRDRAEVVSIIMKLGGNGALPAGAGDGSIIERTAEDPRFGLVRRTRRVEITGSSNPLAFINSNNIVGSPETVEIDRFRNIATGEWLRRERIRIINNRLTRVRLTWSLREGGRPLEVRPVSAGFKWVLAEGSFTPFILTEQVEVFALGAISLNDVPQPARLPTPWRLRPQNSNFALPEVIEYGDPTQAGRPQHFWRSARSWEYVWDDTRDPRSVGTNQAIFMDNFLAGTGGTRSFVSPGALRG